MNPLARMALHRTPTRGRDMPHVPDNRDRVRTYRQISEPGMANGYPWPHLRTFHGSQSGATSPGPTNPAGCQLSYATAEMLDGRDFDTEGYFYE